MLGVGIFDILITDNHPDPFDPPASEFTLYLLAIGIGFVLACTAQFQRWFPKSGTPTSYVEYLRTLPKFLFVLACVSLAIIVLL